MTFDCPVPLLSFNLEPFLSLSLYFMTLTFLEFKPVVLQNVPQHGCVGCFLLVRFMLPVFVRNVTGVSWFLLTQCQFVPRLMM